MHETPCETLYWTLAAKTHMLGLYFGDWDLASVHRVLTWYMIKHRNMLFIGQTIYEYIKPHSLWLLKTKIR